MRLFGGLGFRVSGFGGNRVYSALGGLGLLLEGFGEFRWD